MILRRIVLLLALLGLVAPAAAQDRPLVMEGKSSLYQRVLVKPGSQLAAEAAGAGTRTLPPLAPFFVYAREAAPDGEWLAIGGASTGGPEGWVPEAATIPWQQTLVLSFTNPVGRGPALFFDERDTLLDLVDSEDLLPIVEGLQSDLAASQPVDDRGVVSVEPPQAIDLQENFYFLPILDHDDVYFQTGASGLALRVAAATLDAPEAGPATAPASADYKAGIVFVIDTTKSMGPYIDRTRSAVARLYQRLASSPVGNRIRFGLVAFRDNMDGRPDWEYLTRVYADLETGATADDFFGGVDQVGALADSNVGFVEDSYAGIVQAIDGIDWTGVSGRYVVLVTDANARGAADPLGSTGLDADQVRLKAQSQGVAVFTLHLLTADGRQTHEIAERQYATLTDWPNVGNLYFAIPDGSVEVFGEQVDRLADLLVAQVAAGEAAADVSAEEADDQFLSRAAQVGRAMRLAWLGRRDGTRAPSVIDAWVADRDLIDPTQKTLDVRVLITKDQLSDLEATLQAILEAGEASRISPTDFFSQLQGAAAAMSRRPDTVSADESKRLADTGLIGEYLEDLPYQSLVMELTEDDWLSWGFGQQREFLDQVEAKVALYRSLHDDADLWVTLDGASGRGEAVYPIPLDALP